MGTNPNDDLSAENSGEYWDGVQESHSDHYGSVPEGGRGTLVTGYWGGGSMYPSNLGYLTQYTYLDQDPEQDAAATDFFLTIGPGGVLGKGALIFLGNSLKSTAGIKELMKSSKYLPTQSLSKIDINRVNEYAKLMKSRVWDWSKGKIIVDKNGAIMSGHHRIIAAEKANVQIPKSAITVFKGENLRPIYDWAGKLQK